MWDVLKGLTIMKMPLKGEPAVRTLWRGLLLPIPGVSLGCHDRVKEADWIL